LIVNNLPQLVKDTFRTMSVGYLSFTSRLLAMLRDDCAASSGINTFRRSLESAHKFVLVSQQERYTTFLKERGPRLKARGADSEGTTPQLSLTPPPFGHSTTRKGGKELCPLTRRFEQPVLRLHHPPAISRTHRCVQTVEVTDVTKGDASKKTTKSVRSDGDQVYETLFTCTK